VGTSKEHADPGTTREQVPSRGAVTPPELSTTSQQQDTSPRATTCPAAVSDALPNLNLEAAIGSVWLV
jgi:hypothetical protein